MPLETRWFLQRPVTAKYSLTLHDNVFRCKKKTQKGVSIYHSDTRAMWKCFNNDVKRTTHMYDGIFIDPFDNDNTSEHPLNFASGVVRTFAIKESLLNALNKGRQSSINKLHEEAFDTIRKQHAAKKLLQPTTQV